MSDGSGSKVYFWPYDIFGYLLPGIIVWAPLMQFHGSIRSIIENRYQPDSLPDNVMLVVMCYVTGHLIAAVSSMLLERGLLRLTFGYPLVQFLGEYSKGPFLRRVLMKFTRAHQWKRVAWMKDKWWSKYPFAIAKSVLDFLRRRLDWLPGFVHPLDKQFVDSLNTHFREQFDIDCPDWTINRRSHDMFWTLQAYIMETMPQAYRSSMHFVELYGFSRNACMGFLIAAFFPWCPEWQISLCCGVEFPNGVWTPACLIAAAIMYLNFTKLIRRHNDLLLRAFVASKGRPPRYAVSSVTSE